MTLNMKRGLSDLRWYSLSSAEKYFIASILDECRANKEAPQHLHFDIITEQMEDQFNYQENLPLLLTAAQNRAISDAIERMALSIEKKSTGDSMDAVTRRVGMLFTSYIRSLMARLIRGDEANKERDDALIQILINERRLHTDKGENGLGWIDSITKKLNKVGGESLNLKPIFMDFIKDAEEMQMPAIVSDDAEAAPDKAEEILADEELADMDVVASSPEMSELVKKTFDKALENLQDSPADWTKFLGNLSNGKIDGLENAVKYPAGIGAAANTAFTLVRLIKNHVEEAKDLPSEAFMPGMKSILNRYPGLKKRESLQNFVRKLLLSRQEDEEDKKEILHGTENDLEADPEEKNND